MLAQEPAHGSVVGQADDREDHDPADEHNQPDSEHQSHALIVPVRADGTKSLKSGQVSHFSKSEGGDVCYRHRSICPVNESGKAKKTR
jgi:hypothetical protein